MPRPSLFRLAVGAMLAAAASAQRPPTTLDVLIVLNKAENTASLLDRATGETLATLPTGEGPHEVATSPDGRRAYVCNYGPHGKPGRSLSVLDLVERKVVDVWTYDGWSRPHGIVVSPGGTRLYVTSEGTQSLKVVDAADGREVASVPLKGKVSHMVALSPATGRAFTADMLSDSITAIDLERGVVVGMAKAGKQPEGVAVTVDGREVWAGDRQGDTLSVFDARTLTKLATLPAPGFPIRVQPTPDGAHMLVSMAKAGAVAVYSVKDRKEVRRIPVDFNVADDAEERFFGGALGPSAGPVGLLIAPDGAEAFVACVNADRVAAIDLTTWTISRVLKAGREPDGLALASVPLAHIPAAAPDDRTSSRPIGR